MEPYTVGLTSCGRFDLLKTTLSTLYAHIDGPLEKIIVIEDSADYNVEQVIDQFRDKNINIELIVNGSQIGQVRSIDKLFSRIKTDWVFTCEDDWEFLSRGFISSSFTLMKEFDSCSTVSLQKPQPGSIKYSNVAIARSGTPYRVARAIPRWPYAGFFFGPGLKRMRDYKVVGPYANLGAKVGEGIVAQAYFDLGYRILTMNRQFIRHIGDDRHVHDPVREVGGVTKLKRSIRDRMNRAGWQLFKQKSLNNLVTTRFLHERRSMNNWQNWENHDV